MIITNKNKIEDKKYEILGDVYGNDKHIEIGQESKDLALQEMIKHAEKMGADGIIDVKYIPKRVSDFGMGLMVHGTAIKFIEERKDDE